MHCTLVQWGWKAESSWSTDTDDDAVIMYCFSVRSTAWGPSSASWQKLEWYVYCKFRTRQVILNLETWRLTVELPASILPPCWSAYQILEDSWSYEVLPAEPCYQAYRDSNGCIIMLGTVVCAHTFICVSWSEEQNTQKTNHHPTDALLQLAWAELHIFSFLSCSSRMKVEPSRERTWDQVSWE